MNRAFWVAAPILCSASPAMAGGVFYASNQSAEYFRTFDRNSVIEDADAVYYNMAGTVNLKDGLSLNLSNQTLFQWATVKTLGNPVLGDKTYQSNNPAWLVPNFYAVFKHDSWSVFTSLETIGATAIREWKDGLPTLDLLGKKNAGYGGAASGVIAGDAYTAAKLAGKSDSDAEAAALAAGLDASAFTSSSYLKGSSYYLAWRHGVAWRPVSFFSFAVAGRLVTSSQDIVGQIDAQCTYNQNGHDLRQTTRAVIDVSQKALGYSGEAGLNFYPVRGMVVNLTYEMATKLNFKTTVHDGKDGNGLFVDGQRSRLDLPHALRFGVGYLMSNGLRISAGVNAYLEKYADWTMLDNPANNNDHTKDYDNTFEENLSFEYRVLPSLLVSAGASLNEIGLHKSSTIDTSAAGGHANYLSVGGGVRVTPAENLKINLGIGYTQFVSSYQNADVMGDQALKTAFASKKVSIDPRKEYDKKYLSVALGLEYRFAL